MGKIAGIVCEYNPFHSGHLFQIEQTRARLGDDCTIICCMSGDFVQRGEPAIFDKFARAEAACRCGADIVFELPLPWVLSSAEGFARGAVALLSQIGITHLSFGAESEDISVLGLIADTLMLPEVNAEIKEELKLNPNQTFAAARETVLLRRIGETAALIRTPNNILAVEYMKALKYTGSQAEPVAIERTGSEHDMEGSGQIRSAFEIRNMLRCGQNISAHVPEKAEAVYRREAAEGRGPHFTAQMETAILSRLRMLMPDAYEQLPDSGDGVGRRLYSSAAEEATLDSVYAAAKSRAVTLSRIRRMVMCAALGLKKSDSSGVPGYARLLAADSRGRAFLREYNEANIPIVTKPAAIYELSGEDKHVFVTGAYAHDFYVLSNKADNDKKGRLDWKKGPFIVQD